MISQPLKNTHLIIPHSEEEEVIIFHDIIIPFSQFGNSKPEKPANIYYGNERIIFKERHAEYQNLLINEFSKALKEFRDVMKK